MSADVTNVSADGTSVVVEPLIWRRKSSITKLNWLRPRVIKTKKIHVLYDFDRYMLEIEYNMSYLMIEDINETYLKILTSDNQEAITSSNLYEQNYYSFLLSHNNNLNKLMTLGFFHFFSFCHHISTETSCPCVDLARVLFPLASSMSKIRLLADFRLVGREVERFPVEEHL